MQNKLNEGKTLKYRNTTGEIIKGGSILMVGVIVGVAVADIAIDGNGVLEVEGVFELPKAGVAIAQGDSVVLDAGNISISPTATQIGKAWESKTASDAYILVKINV